MSGDRNQVQQVGTLARLIAEILRGYYKHLEFGKVILPFVVLRSFDCLTVTTKQLFQIQRICGAG